MRMTELATMLMETAKVYGDMEVALMEEGTGEIRYVEAISFDTNGTTVMLEHIDYGEKMLVEKLNETFIEEDEMEFECCAPTVPMDLMEMLKILGGVE